jgi:hypothetical protein
MQSITKLFVSTSLVLIGLSAMGASASTENKSTTFTASCSTVEKYAPASACGRLQTALNLYLHAVSADDHEPVTRALADALAARQIPSRLSSSVDNSQAISYETLTYRNDVWRKWFALTGYLSREDKSTLAAASWRTLMAQAHADPYGAIVELNNAINRNPNDSETGLRLLLAGMMSMSLRELTEPISNADSARAMKAFDTFVATNRNDFPVQELCGMEAVYTGRHFHEVEKRFRSTPRALVAAYSLTETIACGDCGESEASSLEHQLWPLQVFLQKYPNTILTNEVLARAESHIRPHLKVRKTKSAQLPSDDRFDTTEMANVLTRFETALNVVEPKRLVSIKLLLSQVYGKLKHSAGERRIAEWLNVHAAEEMKQTASLDFMLEEEAICRH